MSGLPNEPAPIAPTAPVEPVVESQTIKTTTTTTDRAGDQTETVVTATATLQPTGWRKVLWPLHSRKVQVLLASLIAACAAEYGFKLSDELVLGILALGGVLIAGIAHEDAGRKQP